MGENTEAEAMFRNRWSIYQKVLQGNYLCHLELYEPIKVALASRNGLAVLDLGSGVTARLLSFCARQLVTRPLNLDWVIGDSFYFCKALDSSESACNIIRYTGVDLSAAALTVADKNLQSSLPKSTVINLVLDDMTRFVKVWPIL
jgi:hypothetical protein